jgi:hypothetical protein
MKGRAELWDAMTVSLVSPPPSREGEQGATRGRGGKLENNFT